MKLLSPLELNELTKDEFINYIDTLHKALQTYQMTLDGIKDSIDRKNKNVTY